MIGIVCAMQEEAALVAKHLGLQQKDDTYFSLYGNDRMMLIISKIGKVNAALATMYLIQHYEPHLIINKGAAGKLTKDIQIGQVVFATSVIQHDAYLPASICPSYFTDPIHVVDPEGFQHIVRVTLLTGDQFIDHPLRIAELRYKGDIVDMEGYAIALAALKYHIPCIILKGISDDANQMAFEECMKNFESSMLHTVEILKQLIEQYEKN